MVPFLVFAFAFAFFLEAPQPQEDSMRTTVATLFAASLLTFGCAAATDSTGGGGSPGTAGNGGPGTAGNGGPGAAGNGGPGAAGSNGAGTAGNGGPGTAGSQGSGGSGSTCVADPSNLVNADGWNCDLTTPIAIQGAFYGYTDGSSCETPPANICATGSCCISGTTVVDTTYLKWGCGIGMELNSSGGNNPLKSVYTGPVQCFDITLTGSSGGNTVRIGFTQLANNMSNVAPFVELAAFTNGWSGRVCFTDAECPDWAVTAGTCSKAVGTMGTPYDLQIQVSAGSTTTTTGAFNVCVSKIVPITDPGGTGSTNSCTASTGQGTITDQFGTAHVTCSGKDYVVQNNAWGSTAGQTITYGPGTKFKVTVQNGTGARHEPRLVPLGVDGRELGPQHHGERPAARGERDQRRLRLDELDLGAERRERILQRRLRRLVQHRVGRRSERVVADRRFPHGLVPRPARQSTDRQQRGLGDDRRQGLERLVRQSGRHQQALRLVRRADVDQLADLQPGRLHPRRRHPRLRTELAGT